MGNPGQSWTKDSGREEVEVPRTGILRKIQNSKEEVRRSGKTTGGKR
jgi:hypothetical protein